MAINHYTPANAGFGGSINPISLRDVLALRVVIHWTEAVAVVEALCQRLANDNPNTKHVPELPDILITSRGTLMIRRGASSEQGLDGLGHTLHALLDPAHTPMPLRLFSTHSVGAEYTSVAEFAEALAYYAAPEPDGLITALYARCLEAPAPALEPPTPVDTLNRDEESKPVPTQAKRKIPTLLLFAATFLVMVVSGLAALSLSDSDPRINASVASLKGVVASAAAAVRESFGATTTAAEPAPAPSVAVKAPVAPVRRALSRRAPLPSDGTLASTLVTRYPPGGAPDRVADEPTHVAGAGTSEPSGTIIEPPIYTSGSPGVLPPVMRAPKLPPAPPPQANERDTNTIELLIDESGQVTQARLLSKPVRMPDMMLLSGAKAFKFYPAVKDGKPVKYRLALDWVHSSP